MGSGWQAKGMGGDRLAIWYGLQGIRGKACCMELTTPKIQGYGRIKLKAQTGTQKQVG